MSMIPTSAVAGALIPVQRATHESIRARQVQVQKNAHHNEDVEELDDTALNSVRDQNQRQAGQEKHDNAKPQGERVEIETLGESAQQPTVDDGPETPPHLDISA